MTSSPVKGVNSLMNYASAKAAGNPPNNLVGNFTDAFSKASGQQSFSLQNDSAVQGSPKSKVDYSKKGLESGKQVKTADKAVKTQDSKVNEDVQEEMQNAGQELVKNVAEELGMSEEAVKSAMEALGLTVTDLLNADNMTQLVLTLQGADMLTLMTDEGLYNSLQNLLGMVDDALTQIQNKLEITPEELAAIMKQTDAEAENVPQVQQDDIGKDNQQISAGEEDYTVTVERDGEVVKVSVEVDGNSKTESAEVTAEKVQMPEEKAVKLSEEGENKKDASSQGDNTQSNLLLENLLNRSGQTVKTEATFQSAMTGNTADTQHIMNQIMDYMKVQIKSDLTQMDIQLHPASLGTVNVNITSKEGVITAQFLTQNETVKAAIESQVAQLKNNFEEQGLKVEAVEVAVESHQFGRNLSGDGNGQQQSQDGKKKGGRKINLNELNMETDALMDEAEQIAVDLMNAGGNTVDFTA